MLIISDEVIESCLSQPLHFSYEELREMVLAMDEQRLSVNVGYQTLMYLDYNEVRDTFKLSLFKLKKLIYASERTKAKLTVEYQNIILNLRINHVLLFKNETCSCDICGAKVRYVTLDEDSKNNLHKITLWVINKNMTPIRMTIEHKLARSLGGRDWFTNMIPTCEDCNSKKSTIESRISRHNSNLEN